MAECTGPPRAGKKCFCAEEKAKQYKEDIVGHDFADSSVISGFRCPSTELHEEWLIYMQLPLSAIPYL